MKTKLIREISVAHFEGARLSVVEVINSGWKVTPGVEATDRSPPPAVAVARRPKCCAVTIVIVA